MRERIDYRNNLERLNELFPETEMLNIKQASRVMGYSRDTARRGLPFCDRRISPGPPARAMCGQCNRPPRGGRTAEGAATPLN